MSRTLTSVSSSSSLAGLASLAGSPAGGTSNAASYSHAHSGGNKNTNYNNSSTNTNVNSPNGALTSPVQNTPLSPTPSANGIASPSALGLNSSNSVHFHTNSQSSSNNNSNSINNLSMNHNVIIASTPNTISALKRTTSTSSVRSLVPTTLAPTPSSLPAALPSLGHTPSTIPTSIIAPTAVGAPSSTAPSSSSSSSSSSIATTTSIGANIPAGSASTGAGTHSGVLSPLQPLIKLPDKIPLHQLPRTYVYNHNGLVVGVSAHLPETAQAAMLEYIDLFVMNVLSYSNQWYYIIAALSLDYTCVLANLFACDFFVAVEDLPSALQCLKRAKLFLGNDYTPLSIHTVNLTPRHGVSNPIPTVNNNIITVNTKNNDDENNHANDNAPVDNKNNNTSNETDMNTKNIINSSVTKKHNTVDGSTDSTWMTNVISTNLTPAPLQPILQPQLLKDNHDVNQNTSLLIQPTILANPIITISLNSTSPITETLVYPTTVTKREVLYYHAYDSWLSGNMPNALGYFASIASLYPTDIFASKRAQLLAFLLGNQAVMVNVQLMPKIVDHMANLQHNYWYSLKILSQLWERDAHSNQLLITNNSNNNSVASNSSNNTNNKNGSNTNLDTNNKSDAMQNTTNIQYPNDQTSQDLWTSALLHTLQTTPSLATMSLVNSNHTQSSSSSIGPKDNVSNINTPHFVQPSLHNYYHTFTHLSFYFGMLAFALEQTNSFMHALHSGYLGTLISLLQHHFYRSYTKYIKIIDNGSPLTSIYSSHSFNQLKHAIAPSIANNLPNSSNIASIETNQASIHTTKINKNEMQQSLHFPIYQDPWSHHGMFHALFGLAQHDLALQLGLSLSPQWDTAMSFMYTHNWFHIALMLIARGSFVAALSVVDTALWRFDIDNVSRGKNDKVLVLNDNSSSFDQAIAKPSSNTVPPITELSPFSNHSSFNPDLSGIDDTSQNNNNHNNGIDTKSSNKEDWIYVGQGQVDLASDNIIVTQIPTTTAAAGVESTTLNIHPPSGFYFLQKKTTPSKVGTTISSIEPVSTGYLANLTSKFSMFNYYSLMPKWNVYKLLQILGYQHDDIAFNPVMGDDGIVLNNTVQPKQTQNSHDQQPLQQPQESTATSTQAAVPSNQIDLSQPSQPDQTLFLYYGPHLDSVLHASQRYLSHQQQQNVQSLNTDRPIKNNSNTYSEINSNSANSVHIVPPLEHDHYLQSVIPSLWKQFDVNYPLTLHQEHLSILHDHATGNNNIQQSTLTPHLYNSLQQYSNSLQGQKQHHQSPLVDGFQYDHGHMNGLKLVMPLVNKAHTQDQTGAMGLLWKLELHALCDMGLLCHQIPTTSSNDLFSNKSRNGNNNDENEHNRSNLSMSGNSNCRHCAQTSSSLAVLEVESGTIKPIPSPYHADDNHIHSNTSTSSSSFPSTSLPSNQLVLCNDTTLAFPIIPSLSPRFESVFGFINLNNAHQDPFFDVLVVSVLARTCRLQELDFYIEQTTEVVRGMPAQRREQLEHNFLPLLRSLEAFAKMDYSLAAHLLIPIFIPSLDTTITLPKSSTRSDASLDTFYNNDKANHQTKMHHRIKRNVHKISTSRNNVHAQVNTHSNTTTTTTTPNQLLSLETATPPTTSTSVKTNLNMRQNKQINKVLTKRQTNFNKSNNTNGKLKSSLKKQSILPENTQFGSGSATNVDIVRLLSVFKQNITQNISIGMFSRFSLFITLFLTYIEQRNVVQRDAAVTKFANTKSKLKPLSPFTELLRVQRYLQSGGETCTNPSPLNNDHKGSFQEIPDQISPIVQTSLLALNLNSLACLGGSNEQRDVITDYFCITLFLAKDFNLLLQVINARLGDGESLWLRKLRAQACTSMILLEKESIAMRHGRTVVAAKL